MISILKSLTQLMVITIIISFLVSFIIKLIVLAINFQSNPGKVDSLHLREIRRARKIKRIRLRRLYKEMNNSNELIRYRYGLNDFYSSNDSENNDLTNYYHGK